MRKKAAVQAIAQRHARREALAQEAQRALEGKQQLVAAVARETSPEVKAKSLGVVMGDRAEAADAIRREGEALRSPPALPRSAKKDLEWTPVPAASALCSVWRGCRVSVRHPPPTCLAVSQSKNRLWSSLLLRPLRR